MLEFFSGLKLPKEKTFDVNEAVGLTAKALRGDKTDEEWVKYLEEMAERQVEILNLMVKHQGPEGLTFNISAIQKDARS